MCLPAQASSTGNLSPRFYGQRLFEDLGFLKSQPRIQLRKIPGGFLSWLTSVRVKLRPRYALREPGAEIAAYIEREEKALG
jgi:hypothetical protein